MQKRDFLLIIFLFLQIVGFSQSVWPGDVNNNGIVNKVDLLFLGYAFGETGAARENATEDWNANISPEAWEGSFPNGLNFLYADCNGDGVINELDAIIITNNVGLSHDDVLFVPDEVLLGMEGINPECRFINPPAAAPVDQPFSLEIGLGNMDIPTENISGFTFIVDVEPAILGIDNTEFSFNPNGWIDNTVASAFHVQQKELGEARLKVAYTKIDRVPVTGFGSIASVSFVLETDVIDLFIIDTVTFTLDSIIVLDDELNPIPIVTEPLKLAIDKNLMVSTQEHPSLATIQVYPNPSKGFFLLESSESVLEKLEVVNELGQHVFYQSLNSNLFQSVDLQHLDSGFYWFKIHTKYGVKAKRIQKL